MSLAARTLEEIATCGGVSAVFSAGSTGGGHHWKLFGQNGSQLAHTARVHNGGKIAQLWWKAVTFTGMDAKNDIHVELIGAEGTALARASSSYMKESVTVSDPTGRPLGHTKRHKKDVTVYGPDDVPLAEFSCDGTEPWPVRRPSGDDIGEVLAGEPGPSLSAPLWQWALDTQWAVNTTTYRQAMHLGLRRVNRYSFTPTSPVAPILALLPLLCGLSYHLERKVPRWNHDQSTAVHGRGRVRRGGGAGSLFPAAVTIGRPRCPGPHPGRR